MVFKYDAGKPFGEPFGASGWREHRSECALRSYLCDRTRRQLPRSLCRVRIRANANTHKHLPPQYGGQRVAGARVASGDHLSTEREGPLAIRRRRVSPVLRVDGRHVERLDVHADGDERGPPDGRALVHIQGEPRALQHHFDRRVRAHLDRLRAARLAALPLHEPHDICRRAVLRSRPRHLVPHARLHHLLVPAVLCPPALPHLHLLRQAALEAASDRPQQGVASAAPLEPQDHSTRTRRRLLLRCLLGALLDEPDTVPSRGIQRVGRVAERPATGCGQRSAAHLPELDGEPDSVRVPL